MQCIYAYVQSLHASFKMWDFSVFQIYMHIVALSIRIILRNFLSLLHSATNSHNYHVLMAIEFLGSVADVNKFYIADFGGDNKLFLTGICVGKN